MAGGSLAWREKEKSRVSASLPAPPHSNPGPGGGNAENGNPANKQWRMVYRRKKKQRAGCDNELRQTEKKSIKRHRANKMKVRLFKGQVEGSKRVFTL